MHTKHWKQISWLNIHDAIELIQFKNQLRHKKVKQVQEDDIDILSFQVHELENVGYTMGNSKPMVVRFTYQTLATKLAGQIKKKALSCHRRQAKKA